MISSTHLETWAKLAYPAILSLIVAAGCGKGPIPPNTRVRTQRGERTVLKGGTLPDGTTVDVEIRGNTITTVGEVNAPGVDISGMWLVPAFIDSHVHLALYPAAEELAKAGIAGAVDLASPRADRRPSAGLLFLKSSGPMITVTHGYPTQGWGRGGYGRECDSEEDAIAAVDEFIKAGSDVIKIPIGANGLPLPWAEKVVERAHAHKVVVVAHALASRDAANAGDIEADVLAHLPVEPMDEDTLDVWGERAVITTLAAFGGGEGAMANLQGLRERGALILYGTDLGNVQYAGIHPDEIQLMQAAGMNAEDIIASGTSAPAAFWGFEYLGAIAPGKAASFMLLSEDPIADPLALTRPSHVYIEGKRLL